MALARVVSFDGVNDDRFAEIRRDGPPDGVNATEVIALHDPDTERALVILFFESDDDYRQADEILGAMPAGDTPGTRSGVTKYQVAHRDTTT